MPAQSAWDDASERYNDRRRRRYDPPDLDLDLDPPDLDLAVDLVRAHRSVGLARCHVSGDDTDDR